MDEKTAELRDIFVETTGAETVTERQEESPGSLTDVTDDAEANERVAELVAAMRERYEFETTLSDADLRRIVRGFFDGDDDAELADALDGRKSQSDFRAHGNSKSSGDADADESDVFVARMDLHLIRESDTDAPFSFDRFRSLVGQGEDDETCAAALQTDPETVAHYRRVVEARREATRANDRFRTEFDELLTDSDLSARLAEDARRDGLRDATEDMETDVSL